MKNLKLAMICLALAAMVISVGDAEAGKRNKPKKGARTEKSEEMKVPRRFDNLPSMEFMGGTLTRDAHSGWKLGETPLYVRGDCVITMDGSDDGWLEEGREAVVMGARTGGAISAWSIHVAQPAYKTMGSSMAAELKEAGPNPNVGKIVKPVE